MAQQVGWMVVDGDEILVESPVGSWGSWGGEKGGILQLDGSLEVKMLDVKNFDPKVLEVVCLFLVYLRRRSLLNNESEVPKKHVFFIACQWRVIVSRFTISAALYKPGLYFLKDMSKLTENK